MRRWFLSYHSPDQALAEHLKAALERKDPNARVFFAPASLRAGGFWSKALADQIAQADAFILLVGERGSPGWRNRGRCPRPMLLTEQANRREP
jgi:hypothetical protein